MLVDPKVTSSSRISACRALIVIDCDFALYRYAAGSRNNVDLGIQHNAGESAARELAIQLDGPAERAAQLAGFALARTSRAPGEEYPRPFRSARNS